MRETTGTGTLGIVPYRLRPARIQANGRTNLETNPQHAACSPTSAKILYMDSGAAVLEVHRPQALVELLVKRFAHVLSINGQLMMEDPSAKNYPTL